MKKMMIVMVLLMSIWTCVGCTKEQSESWNARDKNISKQLTWDRSMKLEYATEYSIDYYNDGFVLISISDGSRFLVNTKNKKVPKDLGKDIVVLDGNPSNIYLVASATMDMFDSIDALDHIKLSGTSEDNWYIDSAKEYMSQGKILYAGKYNQPDYEKILSNSCDLAIESTMILHSPEVKENLEKYKIPVLVDYSSYEKNPLGRTEWVKLYGVLTGKEKEAVSAFEQQKSLLKDLDQVKNTGKTVVFFYITSNQVAVVRKTNDYVPKMIELAGGSYLFQDLVDEENKSTSVNMQLEKFYEKAKKADYLVYNSTIDGQIFTIDDLLEKCPILKDTKAVETNHVWCTTQNIYQQTMNSGNMIQEFHKMITDQEMNDEDTQYLYQLQ